MLFRSPEEADDDSGSENKKKKCINANLGQLFAPNIEDDKESYNAEGEEGNDSFDSDFEDPESDEAKEDEKEFNMEDYLKFRQQDVEVEDEDGDEDEDEEDEDVIKFTDSKDDPNSYLGCEYNAQFTVDDVLYPSLAIYLMAFFLSKLESKNFRSRNKKVSNKCQNTS